MVKRLHRAMLLPLCLSMLLSAVPVHASEAGRGNSAVEAAVTEGETVAEEGGEAAAIEETAEVTESPLQERQKKRPVQLRKRLSRERLQRRLQKWLRRLSRTAREKQRKWLPRERQQR